MVQAEEILLLENGKKLVIVTGAAGPASYASATGFPIRVNGIRQIEKVVSITPTTGRGVADKAEKYDESTITGNLLKIVVKEQTVTASAAAATWATITDATDLSAVILTVTVIGT